MCDVQCAVFSVPCVVNFLPPSNIVASTWQGKVQLVLQAKPHENVLDRATGTLMSLQEGNVGLLLTASVSRECLVDFIVFILGI